MENKEMEREKLFQQHLKEKVSLIVGKDYGDVFGLKAEKGQYLIFMGGETWKAMSPGKEDMVKESKGTTEQVITYLSSSHYRVGP